MISTVLLPGGVLALLAEAPPDADVWVLGHVGFEGATRMTDLIPGRLVGARVLVRAWRTPLRDIPADDAGRRAWLDAAWGTLDAWIFGGARDRPDAPAQFHAASAVLPPRSRGQSPE